MDWIDEMIQREAMPEALRIDTVRSFCLKYDIEPKEYELERKKEENKSKILSEMLSNATSGAADVIQALKEKALCGDTKAMEMYIDYVLKLTKKLDPNAIQNNIFVTQEEVIKRLEQLRNN